MEIKLISVTSARDYEQEMGILLSEGYRPMGDLRVEPFIGEWYVDGANHWQRKQEFRYIREMVKECGDDYPVLFSHHRKRNHEWSDKP